MAVGTDLLLCQHDCYLRRAESRVLSCREIKAKKGSTVQWAVMLAASPLYPEGGGQPSDKGQIISIELQLKVNVVDVQRSEAGEVLHITDAPLPEDSSVEVIVDWERRYDLMQQHTGQHLLSAVCDEITGADTVSWELHATNGSITSSNEVLIDLALPQITPDQIQEIEQRCNEVIRGAHAVRQITVDSSNREALASSTLLRGNLPPADSVRGVVRLIEIEGVDINACGGTHLRSTAELQVIKITGLERTRGLVRLRSMAGDRVITAMAGFLTIESNLNKVLGCSSEKWVANVTKLQSDRKGATKRCKLLSEELAVHLGRQHAEATNQKTEVFSREDADMAFLGLIASAALQLSPGRLFFLVGGAAIATTGPGNEGVFVLAGPADAVKRVGPKVAQVLNAKGGGKPGLYQGKALLKWESLEAGRQLLDEENCPAGA